MKTILLLVISNTFMNLAWYGHLKFKNEALWVMILASWGVALFEYIFQVPANRIGSEPVDRAAAEDSAGMHHARCLYRGCVCALSFASEMELPRLLHLHHRRRVLCISFLDFCVGSRFRKRTTTEDGHEAADGGRRGSG
jgi:hypothetical protein